MHMLHITDDDIEPDWERIEEIFLTANDHYQEAVRVFRKWSGQDFMRVVKIENGKYEFRRDRI
jgi:hypothetical protein